jgi:hypothetical protein
MPKNVPEITEEHIVNALQEATTDGLLGLVPYGYCFSCDGTGIVYEVTGDDIPAQPPRCEGCLIENAYDLVDDAKVITDLWQTSELIRMGIT